MSASVTSRKRGYVIGIPIDAVSWAEVQDLLMAWATARESRYVCICNVHSVVTATQNAAFRGVVEGADLATPDGAPVAWTLRRKGFAGQPRINGPDLMWRLCADAQDQGVPIGLFGSTPETLSRLTLALDAAFPALHVRYCVSPPFRRMSDEEDEAICHDINSKGVGLLFVGLGCPKQEAWIAAHRGRVQAVMLGVGAAFDYHAGAVSRAPAWMQSTGFEWLHRLCSEPRRLWRRYLGGNSIFVARTAADFLAGGFGDKKTALAMSKRWRSRASKDSMNIRVQPGGINEVVEGGYCIGCGACTVVVPHARILFNSFGDLVAQLPSDATEIELAAGSRVCPFSDGESETALGERIFNDDGIVRHAELGSFLSLHAAFSHAERAKGSSGGMATWILTTLLEKRMIDFVINVAPSPERMDSRFFSYRVTNTSNDIRAGATSFYYPVSMDEVLEIIRSTPGRYAVTGVPCFHKALRRLRYQDDLINQRIEFQLGIVCGQMKSAHYLEYLTKLAAGEGRLQSACFRRKVPGSPADDYAFEATVESLDRTVNTAQVLNSRIGVNWGMGYFKPQACDYCDDVMAETADVSVMDAWLPKYVGDGLGWSLVAARTRGIEKLLLAGHQSGELALEPLDAAAVANSQRGAFNHRQKALPYRLWLKDGKWTPTKRFCADPKLSFLLRLEQRLREYTRIRSRTLWLSTRQTGDMSKFHSDMRLGDFANRLLNKMKRVFDRS